MDNTQMDIAHHQTPQTNDSSKGPALKGPRILAAISLILWCASLALPALILSRHTYYGLQVLAMGWLGVIFLMVAWLANPIFFYALLRQFNNKPAPIALLLSTIFSLTTFLSDRILMDEGGGKEFIYGYGLGAILWFLSLFILVLAAGWQITYESQSKRPWPLRIGLVSVIGFSVIVSALGLYDHVMANQSERMRMTNIVFKNGPVCTTQDPKPAFVFDLKGRPVQLVKVDANSDSTSSYREEQDAKKFLAWGIPIVRIGNFDYSLQDGDPERLVTLPASGEAGARLEISTIFVPDAHVGGRTETIKVSSIDGEKVAFDQIYTEWLGKYCPEFDLFPNENQQPRKLVIQSLGIKFVSPPPRVAVTGHWEHPVIVGSVVSVTNLVDNAGGSYAALLNKNCPADHAYEIYNEKWSTGVFRIGDAKYSPRDGSRWTGICDEKNVYSYTTYLHDSRVLTIRLKKNSLENFVPVWSAEFSVDGNFSEVGVMTPRITSINDENGELLIGLTDMNSTTITTFTAPSPIEGSFARYF